MGVYPGFLGGSATVRSRNVNAERSINLYAEHAPGHPKADPWMVGTPGVDVYVLLNNAPIRALFAQDNRMWAVSGTSFYEIFPNHTAILRGTAALDNRPATISSNGTNGNQLFVTSGGNGYIYDLTTNVITQIADVDFPASVEMGWFSDGYFGVLVRGTNQFNISALYDGTDWDALDVFQTSTTSDLTVAQVVMHREIYTLGSRNTAVWQDTGGTLLAPTTFQPIGGVSIEQGCGAAYSVAVMDGAVYFVGENTQGDRMVFAMRGYNPERVSTHAVEFALNTMPRVTDTIAWSYQQEGHSFYCLYIPTAETQWVYDVASGLWHERAHWDPVQCVWKPHVARCHAFCWGKHFVGARNSAAVYEMSLDLYTDTLVV
jgi:hypothetical protein